MLKQLVGTNTCYNARTMESCHTTQTAVLKILYICDIPPPPPPPFQTFSENSTVNTTLPHIFSAVWMEKRNLNIRALPLR